MKMIDALDFQKNEAQNLRLQNLASDIGTPVDGLIFYRTDTDKIRAYINGSWQDLATMADVTAGGISSAIIDAKGDLIVGTAADTVGRQAVGADDTLLVAASGQSTGIQWRTLAAGDIPALTGDIEKAAGSSTTSIAAGAIVNADVNASAAIVRSKLDFGSGLVNADLAAGAAIAYSKLNLVGSVTNADLAGSIAYAKLVLTGSVTNADLAGSIALTKLATQAANTILGNNTGGAAAPTALTAAQVKTLLAIAAADISDFNTAVRTNRLDQMAAPTASVSLNSQKITNLADGTAATDAATFGQLNAIINGQTRKPEVDAATTAALPAVTATTTTLTAQANAALAAQDGVTLGVGDSLLVKDQAAPAQNGIYTVTQVGSAGAPFILTRRADADTAAELTDATVFVDGGSVNLGKTYTFPTITTLGTTSALPTLTGAQATIYTGSGGVDITGSVVSLATGGITNTHVNASAAIAYTKLALSNSIVNADINASAAIAYSKLALSNSIVNADINASAAIAYSKLNLASSLLASDVNPTAVASGSGTVRIARTFTIAITGGATSEVITHPLNTRHVVMSLVNPSTPWDHVIFTPESTSASTVTIRSSGNLPAGYLLTIVG
jgi:hypothetical protein